MEKIIIPFGEECYTCQSLDCKFSSSGLRKVAFPFDYVGHTYIENIYECIYDLFFLNNTFNVNDFDKQPLDDKYYACHKKYGFKYWHDLYSSEKEYMDFIEKYNRRYTRLKDSIKNSSNIYILSVNHFDNIIQKNFKQTQVYKLFDLLQSINKNIKFIAVNFGEELYNKENLQFINLHVNYDLPFTESKQEFTNKLYNFTKATF